MTVEIRQLVIKSDVDDGRREEVTQPSGQEDCCGIDPAADSASPQSRRLRAQLAAELERLRER